MAATNGLDLITRIRSDLAPRGADAFLLKPFDIGICRDIVETRSALVVPDRAALAMTAKRADGIALRFFVWLPLASADIGIGALCFVDDQPRPLDADGLRMQAFAARSSAAFIDSRSGLAPLALAELGSGRYAALVAHADNSGAWVELLRVLTSSDGCRAGGLFTATAGAATLLDEREILRASDGLVERALSKGAGIIERVVLKPEPRSTVTRRRRQGEARGGAQWARGMQHARA